MRGWKPCPGRTRLRRRECSPPRGARRTESGSRDYGGAEPRPSVRLPNARGGVKSPDETDSVDRNFKWQKAGAARRASRCDLSHSVKVRLRRKRKPLNLFRRSRPASFFEPAGNCPANAPAQQHEEQRRVEEEERDEEGFAKKLDHTGIAPCGHSRKRISKMSGRDRRTLTPAFTVDCALNSGSLGRPKALSRV